MLYPEKEELNSYLESTEAFDYNNELVQAEIVGLKASSPNEIEFVRNAFEYVRDRFPHSFDILSTGIGTDEISCSASDVVRNGHGICYAKANLLAAILRSARIPSGICYQKLTFSDENPKIILHALNAVFLCTLNKWIRLDARGNKEGVDAQFSIDEERLAFPVRPELGEEDGTIIYANPSANVTSVLKNSKSLLFLMDNLPDKI